MMSDAPLHRPGLVIVHEPNVWTIARQASALRGAPIAAGESLHLVDAGSFDPEQLVEFLHDIRADREFLVFHLMGDQDVSAALTVDGIEYKIGEAFHGLTNAFPALTVHQWVVCDLGRQISSSERALLRRLIVNGLEYGVQGAIALASATSAAAVHRHEECRWFGVDLLQALCASGLQSSLAGSGARVWVAASSSVRFDPERLAAWRLTDALSNLNSLIAVRDSQEPGRFAGRQAIEQLRLGPPRPGETEDPEGRLLRRAPGGGSVESEIDRDLRKLATDLPHVEPGWWPDLIEATLDRIGAPATSTLGLPSPLQTARDQVRANGEERCRDVAHDVELRAREYLAASRSVAATLAWCVGAQQELALVADELRRNQSELSASHLHTHRDRLRSAVRWLPHPGAAAARGALFVILMVVIGYVVSPIGQLAAAILDKRLPSLSDNYVENAQRWARMSAALAGITVAAWFAFRWRRAVRLRRRYLFAARQDLARRVQLAVLDERRRIVETIQALVGSENGDGTGIAAWLVRLRTAMLAMQTAVQETDETSTVSRFAMVLPSEVQLLSFRDRMDLRAREDEEMGLVSHLQAIPLDATVDSIRADLAQTLRAVGPQRSLLDHLRAPANYVDEVVMHLDQDLRPLVDHAFRNLESSRWLIGHVEIVAALGEDRLATRTALRGTLPSRDPNFVASIWMHALTEDDLGASEAMEDERRRKLAPLDGHQPSPGTECNS